MTPTADTLVQAAEQARAAGRAAEATRHAEAVLAIDPGEPRALNLLGNLALASGDAARARAMFERAVESAPEAPALWLNLAVAARAGGDDEAELAALDRSLVLDPYMVLALLQKGQWHERRGDAKGASRIYRDVMACGPPVDRLPPHIQAALRQAEAVIRADAATLEATVRSELGSADAAGRRFADFVEVALGKQRIFPQQPTGLHFPYLPAIPFHDRAMFPWLDRLEAATGDIRDELLALLATEAGFTPYVAYGAGTPVNQWAKLNHSLDWGAFFLWKDGERVEANGARCPKTAALLDSLPLVDVPGRAPSAFFSLLKPGAHIPPHTGVTNTRAIVHLPLVVPDGCRFRVGADVRAWEEGRAWAFDDTIEHEAWNRSGEARAILIFDVWNPLLNEAERDGIRRLTRGMDAHYGHSARDAQSI